MIKAVLLDFDGTLARFQGSFAGLLDSLRAELMLTQCDLKSFAGVLSEELRRDGALTLAAGLSRTLERLELRAGPDLERVSREATQDYGSRVCLLPGALELLESAQGRVPLALVSNGPADMQLAAVERLGLERYFEAILISGAADVATRKPGRRIFELACRRLCIEPEAALMAGDDLHADIAGALAYGLDAVYVGGAEDGLPEGAHRVTDLFALRELLESWVAA